MESMYDINQLLYKKNNIININDFPVLNNELFAETKEVKTEDILCFVFYREEENLPPFVDIYIFDTDGCKRYVVSENHKLSYEMEKEFIKYMTIHELYIDKDMISYLVKRINDKYPYVQLILYPDLRDVLLHVYFTSHRNVVYELLYKSQLNYIVKYMDQMEDINLLATNVQDMFSLPINALKALNTKEGVKFLFTEKERDELACVYSKYHNAFHNTKLSADQIVYLKDIYYYKTKFEAKLFYYLKTENFYLYTIYKDYKSILSGIYETEKYPTDLYGQIEVCERLLYFLEKEKQFNKIYAPYKQEHKRYIYTDDNYTIIVPDGVTSLIKECSQQKNCLSQYIYITLLGVTTILFLRKTKKLYESYITIEIRDNQIIQAYRKYNQVPFEEDIEFLKAYAAEKNLLWAVDYDNKEDEDDWFD